MNDAPIPKPFLNMQRRWPTLLMSLICALVLMVVGVRAVAQTLPIYAVVGSTATNSSAIYVVDPSTAQLSALTSPNILPNLSTAFGVDPLSGRIFAVRRVNATNPALYSYVPDTGAAATVVTGISGLPRNIVRGTACPNGKLYVGAATNTMYEVTLSGALSKTLPLTGLPTGGVGGFACTTDGDFYIIGSNTNGGSNYSIYRIPYSALSASTNGSALTVSLVGAATAARAFSGLAEAPSGTQGCAADPAPCLVASDTTSKGLWGVDTLTGATTRIGTTTVGAVGVFVGDLGRAFPAEFSVQTAATPTSTLQTIGRDVTFTFTVTNTEALANSVTISDPLTFANFSGTPTWTCTVSGPGDPSATFPTACGASSGAGSINTYANFSQNSSITFVLTGVLATTFTGTYTNVVTITLPASIQETPDNANSGNASIYVMPSVNLSIAISNSTTEVTSGTSTTYVITVANTGLSNANGVRLTDPPTTGLSCYAVGCTTTGGTATCPAAGSVTIANLHGSGILHDLPVNSSLSFAVTCNVTASGS